MVAGAFIDSALKLTFEVFQCVYFVRVLYNIHLDTLLFSYDLYRTETDKGTHTIRHICALILIIFFLFFFLF